MEEYQQVAEIDVCINFESWWRDIGSGIRPLDGEDHEEHARRLCRFAWEAAINLAASGRPMS